MPAEDPFWTRLPKVAPGVLRAGIEFGAAPQTMIARMFCLEVLRSAPIQGVSFKLPFCEVTPDTFAEVALAILRGGISTRVMGPGDPDFDHAQAVFVTTEDVMKIAQGDWVKRDRPRTAVVHEAVHAHHDMTGRADLLVVQTEQAGFIAECVFARCWRKYAKAQFRPPFLTHPADPSFNDIFEAAWAVALAIVDDGRREVPADDPSFVALHDAIRQAPPYRSNWNTRMLADGLRW